MSTPLVTNSTMENALSFVKIYIPDTIVDNWRVVGTTAVMVGLCLCPIIASAWESPDASRSPPENDDSQGEEEDEEAL